MRPKNKVCVVSNYIPTKKTVLVGLMGLFGSCTRNKCLLTAFLISMLILFLVQIAIAAVALIEYYDVNTLGVISETQANLVDKTSELLAKYALENPQTWFLAQGALGCCGYNYYTSFETVGNATMYYETAWDAIESTPPAWMAASGYNRPMHSGANCTELAEQELDASLVLFPEYNESHAEFLRENATYVSEAAEYYCETKLFNTVEPYYLGIGISAAVTGFLTLLAVACTIHLVCCVSHEDGGYNKKKPTKEEAQQLTGFDNV